MWGFRSASISPFSGLSSLRVRSQLDVISVLPSGVNARPFTFARCGRSTLISFSVAESKRPTSPENIPAAIVLPSGEYATDHA